MFQITEYTEAHVASVTNRQESHGDEKVPAVSITLELTCANTMLDLIDPTLRQALYKPVDNQDQLPGVEPSTPVLRCNSIDRVVLPTCHEGWSLAVDDGIDDTDPLLFGGVGTALGMGPAFWAMALVLGGAGVFARRRHRA